MSGMWGSGDSDVDSGRVTSAAAEAVGEKFVGVACRSAGVGRAEPDEREGLLRARVIRRQPGGQLGGHELDADSRS
jgi:hypothetical protein